MIDPRRGVRTEMVRWLPGRLGLVDATVARSDVAGPKGYRTNAATLGRFSARLLEHGRIRIRGTLSESALAGGRPGEPVPCIDRAGFSEPSNGAATIGGLDKPPITDPTRTRCRTGDPAVPGTIATSIGDFAQ